jgi:hypothetical protein
MFLSLQVIMEVMGRHIGMMLEVITELSLHSHLMSH